MPVTAFRERARKPKEEELLGDRVERFEELRFTLEESKALAKSTQVEEVTLKNGEIQRIEVPLHPSKVKKVLDAGCGHRLAYRIFAPLPGD